MMCKHDDGCNAPEGECSGACMTQDTHIEGLDDADFIERMRRFSVDHEPNGWPAVQMHQIIRLCDLADANIPAVKALREENERLKIAAKYAEHIDATPENQLQTMLYDTCIERDALKSQLAELRQGGEACAGIMEAEEFANKNNLAVTDDWISGWSDARKHLSSLSTRPQPAIPPGYAVPERLYVGHPRITLKQPLLADGYVCGWNECRAAMLASAPAIQPQAAAPIAGPEVPDDVLEILRVVADFDHYDEDDEEFTQMPTDERLLVAAQKARAWFAAAPSVPVAEKDSFDALVAAAKVEAGKAMRKFPHPNKTLLKVAEEAGEVVKAGVHLSENRDTPEHVRDEMKQTIAMLYRLWVEGDGINGVPAIGPALAAPADSKEGE